MIEAMRPDYRPIEPVRPASAEPPEEILSSESQMEASLTINENASGDSTASTSIPASDSFGGSSPPQIPDPIIETAIAQNAPRSRRLQEIVANGMRQMLRRARGQQRRQPERLWEKYHTYLRETENSQLPPVYKKGMRLLLEKTFRDRIPVSREDLMTNPTKYFPEDDNLNSLRKLQAFLLNAVANHPLNEYEWWALERLFCLTSMPASRNKMIRASRLLVEKDPIFVEIFLANPNLPLSTLRYHLAAAEGAPRGASRDPYYKSDWEQSFDAEISREISNTIERIDNKKLDATERLRQNEPIANSSARVDRATRQKARKKISEDRKMIDLLTATKTTLEEKHARLQRVAAIAFLRLAKQPAAHES